MFGVCKIKILDNKKAPVYTRSASSGDDALKNRVRLNDLYDLYSPLLTERQRDAYEMRYFSDLSLAEIAASLGVSRQAVHILTNRTAGRLCALEEALGLGAKILAMEERIGSLEEELEAVKRCSKP
ncbi:hypothetical protein AGMMS50276_16710 [Synergistales bacterium]|nr:hypothetical protein AGMMS50276_16710 [Synergistales bacterium]